MSYNVLIVDDSYSIRAYVKKSIDMSGIAVSSVFEAQNGKEALDILNREWVDIVFADLNMPEMGGLELVEKMSEDSTLARTPVVIISSVQRQATIDALKAKGVRAFMKKPFRPEAFRDVVHDILGKGEDR